MTIEADMVIKRPGQVRAEEAAPRLDKILWFRGLMEKSGSVDAVGSRLTGDELRIAVNGGVELLALQIRDFLRPPNLFARRLRKAAARHLCQNFRK